MGTIVALMIVVASLLLPFLDKIIEYLYPRSALSESENTVDQVLNETDCARIHKMIE